MCTCTCMLGQITCTLYMRIRVVGKTTREICTYIVHVHTDDTMYIHTCTCRVLPTGRARPALRTKWPQLAPLRPVRYKVNALPCACAVLETRLGSLESGPQTRVRVRTVGTGRLAMSKSLLRIFYSRTATAV